MELRNLQAEHADGSTVGFGHRRLAIVDLSPAGHQPMSYRDRYVITYNGEIYNHVELREELQTAGHRFSTRTDTEVILAAYDLWGADCLRRFNGMWAFALLDRLAGRLLLARDRFGVKPLYLYHRPGLLLFASEIKALLPHPAFTSNPAVEAARAYLRRGPAEHLDETLFSGVVRLSSGSFIEASVEDAVAGRYDKRRYFGLTPSISDEPFDAVKASQLADRYRQILDDAVRLRLRADVKVGSALSGGLDSSSVVKLANAHLRALGKAEEMQETFSSVYRSPGLNAYDESRFIDSLARELGVRSHQTEPSAEDVRREYGHMIHAMDTPPEGSCMSGWHVFKLVAGSDVVVTLDGQGADEQLAGYFNHLVFRVAAGRGVAAETWALRRVPRAARFLLLGTLLASLGRLGLRGAGREISRRMPRLALGDDPYLPLNQRLATEIDTALGNLLHYSDRASMAWSVESRMPFMDYRLIEFTLTVPPAYKIHDGWTKYLARRAFDGILPDEIVWRRDKMGWPVPDRVWFDGPLAEWRRAVIAQSEFVKYVDAARVATAVSGRLSHIESMRLLNLAVWHGVYFGSNPESYRAALPFLRGQALHT
jgi:asparagine synthase (glutamine-hydrolysing)